MGQTWFETTAKANFAKWLSPLADEPLRCLQLGAFRGDASVWILENLTKATLVDVDTWEGSDEHAEIDMAEVRDDYLANTATWAASGGRVEVALTTTWDYLCHEWMEQEFDFIYVDADHQAKSVLTDAVLAWPRLCVGGMMAFDDYLWGEAVPYLETPKPAIDSFVTVFGNSLTVLECNAQVWVRKDDHGC